MENEVGIILASHGKFAIEALNSLEMIMGKQKNIIALSLFEGENLADFVEKMEKAYENLEKSKGVVIICDIYGGTPSNAAATMLLKKSDDNIAAFAGLNLSVMLEVTQSRKIGFEETLESIQLASENSWREIRSSKKREEEEMDL